MSVVKPPGLDPVSNTGGQSPRRRQDKLRLESRTLDALPVINHFLDRLGIARLLEARIPALDPRCRLAPAVALGVLLRNLLLGRAPLYSQEQWARRLVPEQLGLSERQLGLLNDDRVGRALDALFMADRASMLTEIVLTALRQFKVNLAQLHNDSTTVTFSGDYPQAIGRRILGKRALKICRGHNKDHRPDLKQLLFGLTVSADGSVPVHYQALDGNIVDVSTHLETWRVLRALAGRPDFLYVADCKLCDSDTLQAIDRDRGRFITILPRNRREDRSFRDWLQQHAPAWDTIASRPNPRDLDGPPEVFRAIESPIPCADGFRLLWVHSSFKHERDRRSREQVIEQACGSLEDLPSRLQGPRCRYKTRASLEQALDQVLTQAAAQRWLRCSVTERLEPVYRQERRGRPGSTTRYLRATRLRFDISWQPDQPNLQYDARCDGIFPLVTNCRELSMAQLLAAYNYQPMLEKRHEQFKSVHEVAPVWLKNEARIEALLFMYFIVLLVQALIERDLRLAMKAHQIDSLPLYPEQRECRAPSTNAIFQAFRGLQQHRLYHNGAPARIFPPALDELQTQLLTLLKVPVARYTG